jgi:amino acid adenylation domain-containing protein
MLTENIQGFRLSPQQRQLWLAQQQEGGGHSPYLSQCVAEIAGRLDASRLEDTLREMSARHEILRTSFRLMPGMDLPLQVIAESAEGPSLERQDLSALDAAEQHGALKALAASARAEMFDPEQDTLLRAALVALAPERHALVLTLPALCGDAASLANLLREIALAYAGDGAENEDEEAVQYADLSEILNELIETDEAGAAGEFWREKLSVSAPLPKLPFETAAWGAAFAPAVHASRAGAGLLKEIESRASRLGVTTREFLFAGWQALLARMSGQAEMLLGVAFDGRTYEQLGEALGLFVKHLPVSCRVEDGLAFGTLAGASAEALNEAAQWQDYFTWEKFANGFDDAETVARLPFVFSYDEAPRAVQAGGLSFKVVSRYECTDRFKLKLSCVSDGEDLLAEFCYDSALFDAESVERLAGHFLQLLSSAARGGDATVGGLEMLSDEQRHYLLSEFNDTALDFGPSKCLHQLCEEQAARTPDALAVVFEGEELTYAELNARANRLARHLRRLGVGPEVPVAVCVERSVEMIVSLLAVLKAGGAYVPLDPSQPKQRLAFILDDTRAPLLLLQESVRPLLPEHSAREVSLDADSNAFAQESEENPRGLGVTPENLAYVIYTSGSTGRPKGVQVSHRAVNNHLLWMQSALPLNESDRLLHKTPFGFDASIWELFTPLIAGARLVIARPGGHKDSAYLAQTVREQQITILQLVPSMLRVLLEDEASVRDCRSLRRVFCGGEVLTADLRDRLHTLLDAELINFYGPTEAAIDVTFYACPRDTDARVVPIGSPLSNVQIYVVDARLQPVPVGVAGELLIGGVTLARGYLGRPDLTAERFIPNPFSGEQGARLYRTGDLARHTADGLLEFVGRLDNQVKIRGFRIELGEIESVMGEHPSAGQVVSMVREDEGEKHLVAYFVARQGAEPPTPAEWRQYMKERLPEYMIPSVVVTLERLPLNTSGKVDRKALPAPDLRGTAQGHVAPRTLVEEVLAGIWCEVLKAERVGATDNFFELGGHSLLVTQVMTRVRDAFGLELRINALFNAGTLAELAQHIESEMKAGRGVEQPPLVRVPRDAELPLSFAQQRLWFLDQLEPGNTLYNIPTTVRLKGRLDVETLRRALAEIVKRHESLRTTFTMIEGRPAQLIAPSSDVPLEVRDLSAVPSDEAEAEGWRLIEEEAARPFDLASGPMFRVLLVRLGESEHLLLCTMHHIVSDIWSRGVLIREVSQLYTALLGDETPELPALPIQYADFAAWEREWLQGETLDAALDFWRARLQDAPPVLKLPTDFARPHVQTHRGSKEGVALSASLLEGLRSLSRREGATMFMTLLAAFDVLLQRYTGQSDIVVGTPVANRERLEIEGLIGFFTNTLVVRADLSGNPTFRDFLRRVRESALEAYAHRDLPFELLVEELQPERDLGYSPLFQVMFVHQMTPSETLELPDVTVERVDAGGGTTSKYDLTLFFVERPDSCSAWVEYNTDLFEPATIKRMLGHLQVLLEGVARDPERKLGRLPLLTSDEWRETLYDWNATAREYGQPRLVHQLFEAQAALRPDAPAVEFEGERLSYAELNRRANQLARHLRAQGVGPDVPVAICMERSTEMIVAVLGVVKAGGLYVPIDATYPKGRLSAMLEDAAPLVLLTQERLAESLPEHGAQLICVDSDAELFAREAVENLDVPVAGENLIYVVYTSGSTGKPKGIAMGHAPFFNLVAWQMENTELREDARTLQFASLSFDVSCQEIFSTLGSGGTLVLVSEEVRHDMGGLLRYLDEERINKTYLPVVVLHQLAEEAQSLGVAPAYVREFTTSGAQLQITKSVTAMLERLEGCTLYNQYGPSETHVVTEHPLRGRPAEWAALPPIGRPVANTQIYVLDEHLQPVPAGFPGELYIGGDCLARGYVNRPDLTAEKFIPDPFSSVPGARLYRSGDMGRHTRGGLIECLGRADHQVKIRGFRVELGEIETLLGEHAAVEQVVVLTGGETTAEQHLIAYLVLTADAKAEQAQVGELRQYLKERLPDYMIPSAFVALEQMPLTSNGKVDRKALPAPDVSRQSAASYIAPRTPVEEVLAGVWSEVLKAERVGATDNFFELGGHSLLVTQVMTRVRDAFKLDIQLRLFFEEQTLEGLAAAIDRAMKTERGVLPPPIETFSHEGPLPLSFIQERIWQMAEREGRPSFYNFQIRLSGPLDAAALERSLAEVIRRHESLRTTFEMIEGRAAQLVNAPEPFGLPLLDLSGHAETAREAEVKRLIAEQAEEPFDLTRAPLHRFVLLRLEAETHLLLFAVPHIVCDHTSVGLLAVEVSALYDAFRQGLPSPLPELSLQYADFALWEREWLRGEVFDREIAYWRRQLEGCRPALSLPTDRPRPAVKTYCGAQLLTAVPLDLSSAVDALSRRENCTPFMTLLAAFKSLLYRYTGERDMIVGTAVAGRTLTGVERLIGNFGTPLALRTRPRGDLTFRELLRQVREVSLEAYAHQNLPFDLLVEELKPEQDPSFSPLIQVGFVVHNAEQSAAAAAQLGDVKMELASTHSGRAIFDLTVRLHRTPEGLFGGFEYNTDLFDAATVKRMIEQFQTLLASVVADPDQKLEDLPL